MSAAELEPFRAAMRARQIRARIDSCVICGRPILWVVGHYPRRPMTCGRMECGKKAGEAWAKYRP